MFNTIPHKIQHVCSIVEREMSYVEPFDEIDVETQSVKRKPVVMTKSVYEPETPQEGLSIYVGNIGYMLSNHIAVEHGNTTFMVHHGNPYLDCHPLASLSQNFERIEKGVESYKAKLADKEKELKSNQKSS